MSKTEDGQSRRDVLKLAALTAPAAAAAAVTGTSAEAASPEPAEGMKDTAHTRAYYASARF